MRQHWQPRRSTTSSTYWSIGSGGGGMTAALAAQASGLDDAGHRKVQPLRRFHRAVRGRHLGTGSAGATPGRLHAAARRRRRLPAAHHRRLGQRRANSAVRRLGAGDDGVPRESQPVVRVRLEARLCRLLPRTARRLRTRQHDQRSPYRSAHAGRRGAAPAGTVGAGAARNLAGAQRASLVLPGAPVLGR